MPNSPNGTSPLGAKLNLLITGVMLMSASCTNPRPDPVPEPAALFNQLCLRAFPDQAAFSQELYRFGFVAGGADEWAGEAGLPHESSDTWFANASLWYSGSGPAKVWVAERPKQTCAVSKTQTDGAPRPEALMKALAPVSDRVREPGPITMSSPLISSSVHMSMKTNLGEIQATREAIVETPRETEILGPPGKHGEWVRFDFVDTQVLDPGRGIFVFGFQRLVQDVPRPPPGPMVEPLMRAPR